MAVHYVTQEEMEEELKKMDEVAKLIYDYAGKSTEHEDAVLNVIGEDCYEKITDRIQSLHAYWIDNHNGTISCSHCNTWFNKDNRYPYMRHCPYCNTGMDHNNKSEGKEEKQNG